MNKPLPSIRRQLLRIHLLVAFAAGMVFFVGVTALDWQQTRQLLSVNFENNMKTAAHGSVALLLAKDIRGLKSHLKDFHELPGMQALCLYDADNTLVSAWHASAEKEECPALILQEGMQKNWLDLTTAIALMKDENYLGMLYAHGRLTVWHGVLSYDGIALMVLVLFTFLTCYFSSRYGGAAMTKSLTGLKDQIDCLKNNDYTMCKLLPPMTTIETASLAKSVTEFRTHLAMETLPRGELSQVRQWYDQLFSGLLNSMRARLEADSPLLDFLRDYEQLLRMEAGAKLPEPLGFDVAKLLRAVITAVRVHYPADALVSLNVTLQPSAQHEWTGQPELLSLLLQHLLFIALRRTRQGAVCMRLAMEPAMAGIAPRLTIKLEDSGPPLQRWQLVHWLDGSGESLLSTEMAQDISWLITGRLLRVLGGSANAHTDANGGLFFTGWVPVNPPQAHSPAVASARPKTHAPREMATQPLLLVVEDNPEKLKRLTQLFTSLHCRTFAVADHAQAMLWAPVLPVNVLVLNSALADARSMAAQRLQRLAEEGLMPHVPLWAMVSTLSVSEEEYWENAGVSILLPQPLKQSFLEPLCAGLGSPDKNFYLACDAHLRSEFPANIVAKLPELQHEIARQVRQLQPMILALCESEESAMLGEQVHAVKSASLTLGYYRLAALMAEIEHALMHRTFKHSAGHWRLIAEFLDAGVFEPHTQQAVA